MAHARGAELLGRGDLLRPEGHDGDEAVLPFEATWRVLQPLRLAELRPQPRPRPGRSYGCERRLFAG